MPGSSPRQHSRYWIQMPVHVQSRGSLLPHRESGWTQDLSEGGSCLELLGQIPPPTRVDVHLLTHHGRLRLRAQVVWTARPEAEGRTRHGVQFLPEPSREARQGLRAFLGGHAGLLGATVRLPLELPVTCRVSGGPEIRGRTGDLGPRGLSLRLPAALEIGTAVSLALAASEASLQVGGHIVWVHQADPRVPGEPILHGLRFTEPLDPDWLGRLGGGADERP